jgi:hypothetical protein
MWDETVGYRKMLRSGPGKISVSLALTRQNLPPRNDPLTIPNLTSALGAWGFVPAADLGVVRPPASRAPRG